MVVICAAIAWIGADDLDKFVALVGSFACIPLVYIYPVSIKSISFPYKWNVNDHLAHAALQGYLA